MRHAMTVYLNGVVLQDEAEHDELCKQQGKAPLSASDMLLLDGSRQHLRAALDHARMRNIKESHLQLIEASPQLLYLVNCCVLSKDISRSLGLTLC